MLTITEFPLPDDASDADWLDCCALARAYNHELIGGPGWDVDPADLLHLVRADKDHVVRRWLARDGGVAVGLANLRVNVRDSPEAASPFVTVLPSHRRRGVGRALADALQAAVVEGGFARATCWITAPMPGAERLDPTTGVGAVPADHDGMRMALAHGFTLEQVERVSRYDFASPLVDPAEAMAEAAAVAGADYEVVAWEGATPDDVLDGFAVLKARMATDPPSGGLAVITSVWDAQRVRELDAKLLPTHRIWRTVVRHRPSGKIAAVSELLRDRNAAEGLVEQWDTIVLPEHRGRRLGMLVKAANLVQVREAAPDAEAIITWNAEENRHMLAVNEALGFYPIMVEGAFQRHLTP